MPTDEWRKAEARRKSAGRDYATEVEREAKQDASVDAWIAKREAELAASKRPKKKRKNRKPRTYRSRCPGCQRRFRRVSVGIPCPNCKTLTEANEQPSEALISADEHLRAINRP